MRGSDRLLATGLTVLVLVLWAGFLVHRSERFAGSGWGGVLGVSGGALMLVPLAYSVVKRGGPVKRAVTARVSMKTLLTWHVYAGIVGPILALLHTGHKFESPLGVFLTAMMLVVVLSGFVGHYLMGQVTGQLKEKKELLTRLEAEYRKTAGELSAQPQELQLLRPFAGFWPRLAASVIFRTPATSPAIRAVRIADSMADVEYAIKTHEAFRRWFAAWLKIHIAISLVLYALLLLHVWAAVHFGVRWFS